MSDISDLRKAIRAQFPSLSFRVRRVDFTDLARGDALFVASDEWGMTTGNHATYEAVKAIADKYHAIVEW